MNDEPKVGEVWEWVPLFSVGSRLCVVTGACAESIVIDLADGPRVVHCDSLKRRVELRDGQVWRHRHQTDWKLLAGQGAAFLIRKDSALEVTDVADLVREGWTLVSEPEEPAKSEANGYAPPLRLVVDFKDEDWSAAVSNIQKELDRVLADLQPGTTDVDTSGHIKSLIQQHFPGAEVSAEAGGRIRAIVPADIPDAEWFERHCALVAELPLGIDLVLERKRQPIDMRPLAEAFASLAEAMQTPQGIVILNRQWCDEQVANPPRWARDGRGVARGERFEAFKVGLCNEVARYGEPSLVDEWIGRDGKKRFFQSPVKPAVIPCSDSLLVANTMKRVRQYVDQQCGEAPAWV